MSILIKDMEMPKNCKDCPLSDHEAWCLIPGDWRERYYCPDDERSEYCPLIEISTPHDDLVSRQWIRDSINRSCWLEHNDYLEAVGIVDDAPNVIEAEGSET